MQSNDKRLNRYTPASDSESYSVEDSIESHALIKSHKQSNEMLSRILSDRLYFIRNEIDEITRQIDERQAIKQSLDNEIDERVCQVRNIIYLIELDIVLLIRM